MIAIYLLSNHSKFSLPECEIKSGISLSSDLRQTYSPRQHINVIETIMRSHQEKENGNCPM